MNGELAENMRLAGIIYSVNYGVSIPELKELAKPYSNDHELALALFNEEIRECKLLASLIDNPESVTGNQIDEWAESFTNPELVEQVCSNLFWKSEYALSRSIEWCISNDEYLRKAGLIIIARKVSGTNLPEKILEPYLSLIENIADEVTDTYQTAMLSALRQIAKHSESMRKRVLAIAETLSESDNELAGWIAGEISYEFDQAEQV